VAGFTISSGVSTREPLALRLDARFVADEDRVGDALLLDNGGGADHLRLVAFGENDALGARLGPLDDPALHLARLAEAGFEPRLVLVDVDVNAGDPRLHGRFGDSGGHRGEHAAVERLWNQVFGAELQRLEAVRLEDGVRHVFLRQGGDRFRCGDLHLIVDRPRPDVERAPEDEREPEHVVHLIRVVRAARSHDRIGSRRLGVLVRDLGIRVGQGEDDRPLRHRLQHFGGDGARDGEPEHKVGAGEGVGERPGVRLPGELLFVPRHSLGPALVNDPFGIDQREVLLLHAELDEELGAGDRRGAGTVHDGFDLGDLLAGDLEGVLQCGAGDDRRPVLVVVEDGDLHDLLEALFDFKTGGRGDVFEVDPAEGRLERLDHPDYVVGIGGVDFDVEDVDVGEALEEDAFPLHHRL